jgi:hypothetical protein
MISVSLFLTRKQNILEILKKYEFMSCIDEILIVSLEKLVIKNKPDKLK